MGGTVGLRIFNLLNERWPPQRLEDKDIFQTRMVPHEEGREVLNEMVCRHMVSWQEVPRSAASSTSTLASSFWLYYVDPRRVDLALVQNSIQAILNMRVRFR